MSNSTACPLSNVIQLKLLHGGRTKYAFVNDSELSFINVVKSFERTFSTYDHQVFRIEFHDCTHFVELNDDINLMNVLCGSMYVVDNFRRAVLRSVRLPSAPENSETTSISSIIEASVGLYEELAKVHRMRLRLDHIKTILIVTKIGDPQLIDVTKRVGNWIRKHYPRLIVRIQKSMLNDIEKADGSSTAGNPDRDAHQQDIHTGGINGDRCPRADGSFEYWDEEWVRQNSDDISLVITLGGDGTVLYTGGLFQRYVPPVVSFHLGSLGFLTNFILPEYDQILPDLLGGKGHHVNLRQRLCCQVRKWKGSKPPTPHAITRCSRHDVVRKDGDQCAAVKEQWETSDPEYGTQVMNEVVLDRGPNPGLMMLELYADGLYLTTIQADGLVIATSTGSTAYSLSAGGSLVHPDKNAILITPICPHTLTCRPMILPGRTKLKVVVSPNSRWNAWASFDARSRMELGKGDGVLISVSQYPFLQICRDDQTTDWCRSLVSSLHWNERETQKPLL
ncbi:ATP-NAD kinase-like domain-containing protein [Phlyctochytrium arcticum]|nr:ATP-NAD kinase-like domain-containing protein [Phlyctochytrium arcticum]